MRNPRDFAKPLAVGAPDPVLEIPFRPSRMIHFFDSSQREDGGEGAGHRQAGRHPARQPRGRGPGRPQGGRPRGPREGRPGDRPRRHAAVDARQQPREPVGARRPHAARRRDRRQARRDHGPEGRGRLGHPLRRPPARPARGQIRRREADPRPRDPRDGARRREPRGDRRRLPAHAGHELRPGRPRRLAAHEDDARRRRPPRLPRDRGPGPGQPRGAARERPAGPVALLDRAHGRRLHGDRDPPLLRPVRRHQGRRRLRGAVPRRLPAGLRRRLVAAPAPDRDRQEGLLARPRRGHVRPARDRGDPRRRRRAHDRRQDAGRRHLEAVQGDGRPRRDARRRRTRSWPRPTGSSTTARPAS